MSSNSCGVVWGVTEIPFALYGLYVRNTTMANKAYKTGSNAQAYTYNRPLLPPKDKIQKANSTDKPIQSSNIKTIRQ